ncbi:MAG: 2-C-methyl-D-erythritol 4-phosphate cytidylyltransferase [Treponema sp.]|nr:2-C-methyl-D-erythritol 4-phosphate cytidylyltransferase [Treponema sp.]
MKKTIHSKIAVIITAAGSSTRIGGGIKKEYLPYKNGTVLSACASVFLTANYPEMELAALLVTCPKGGQEKAREALYADSTFEKKLGDCPLIITEGGDSRQASVRRGLLALKEACPAVDYVLIHDGARPFLSADLVREVASATVSYSAAVPGLTPTDTQKEVDADGFVVRHLVRGTLSAVQTPQGFEFVRLVEAHEKARQMEGEREFTDDTEIWGAFCGAVKVIPGEAANIKITYPSDLEKL